jgi:hypothetical protein
LDVEWASELGVHLWNSKQVMKLGEGRGIKILAWALGRIYDILCPETQENIGLGLGYGLEYFMSYHPR